ncbi:MAG: replication initiation protein, partial [Cetobacterium sp.]|uniref:replication initiation protein n=1 Tax=Cetobacterium sp. TaxID=2071632 RepID=UPI002FC6F492
NELSIPKLKDSKVTFLERLARKGVFFINNGNREYVSFFSYLGSTENTIKIEFNKKFLEYFKDKEKILKYNIQEIIYLKYNFSIDFYFNIIKQNILKSTISISLEKLRNILKIDNYSRMYDFKRFVLVPLANDISSSTDFKIEFFIEKMEGENIITFKIKNCKIEIIKNYTKLFLSLYKKYITDYRKVSLLIFNSIQLYGYDYTKSKVILTIKNKNKYDLNFDDLLEGFLFNKLGEFFILLKSSEESVKNLDEFRKAIHRELHPLAFPEIQNLIYNTEITKILYSKKPGENFTIDSQNLKLELFFNPSGASKIEIYKRNDTFNNEIN